MHFVRNMGDANTNAPTIVSLRGAQRRSNLVFYGEIAAPPSVARTDRVAALFASVLGKTLGEDRRMPVTPASMSPEPIPHYGVGDDQISITEHPWLGR